MLILKEIGAFVLFYCFIFNVGAQDSTLIYDGGSYKWYNDRIVQGDFVGRALSDEHIITNYTAEIKKNRPLKSEWVKKNDLHNYPHYRSQFSLENAIFNMGLDEMVKAIEPNLTLRTGELWGGVWTRDVSYSTILAMAYMQPTVAKNCLLKKVDDLGRIIQDTGTGGSWPCSTDRIIWVSAAWEIYKVTGDRDWMKTIYPVIKKSADDDIANIYDNETGLVMGESSFIDWREQSYPEWMQPVDIFKSKCLGTNAIHYQAFRILSKMANSLQIKNDVEKYEAKAEQLKNSINKHLWMPEKGYYSQFLYGRNSNVLSPKSETLGEALCILFDIASPGQQKQIIERMPVVAFGPTIFYPQIPDIPPYHNNAIWPFVSSYWTLASAKSGNQNAVLHGVGSIYRAAALFATNKENFVADNGDCQGTEINSGTMLWSLSGNISMVVRLLFGINYEENGIYFKPFIPEKLEGERHLANFNYRNSILDISIVGWGNRIKLFTLDNQPSDAFIPGNLSGKHTINIILESDNVSNEAINLIENKFTLQTPKAVIENDILKWSEIKGATLYAVLKDGKEFAIQKKHSLKLKPENEGEYQVIAKCKDDVLASFASEPVKWNKTTTLFHDMDSIVINKTKNRLVNIKVEIATPGYYSIDFLYSNGNGNIKFYNKCATRTLLVDGDLVGAAVFPQRGDDNWHEKGWSNSQFMKFKTGEHIISLEFRKENENMNIEINDAVLYQLRLIRIK